MQWRRAKPWPRDKEQLICQQIFGKESLAVELFQTLSVAPGAYLFQAGKIVTGQDPIERYVKIESEEVEVVARAKKEFGQAYQEARAAFSALKQLGRFQAPEFLKAKQSLISAIRKLKFKRKCELDFIKNRNSFEPVSVHSLGVSNLTPQEQQLAIEQSLLMTLDEFIPLRNQIQDCVRDAEKLRTNLCRHNEHIVDAEMLRYVSKGLGPRKMRKAGRLGLYQASLNFDYTRGYRFGTYGQWWVRYQITKAIASNT